MLAVPTPGRSWARVSTFLPLSGMVVRRRLSTVAPTATDCVSTATANACTSTDSLTEPNWSVASTRTFRPTSTITPGCEKVLNPDASTVTLYEPGGVDGIRYPPSELVQAKLFRPVASFSTCTFALPTAAPPGSV